MEKKTLAPTSNSVVSPRRPTTSGRRRRRVAGLIPPAGSVTTEVPAAEQEGLVKNFPDAMGNPVFKVSAAGIAFPPTGLNLQSIQAKCYQDGDDIPADPANEPNVTVGTIHNTRHWEFRNGNEIPVVAHNPVDSSMSPNILVVWAECSAGGPTTWVKNVTRFYGKESARTDLDP